MLANPYLFLFLNRFPFPGYATLLKVLLAIFLLLVVVPVFAAPAPAFAPAGYRSFGGKELDYLLVGAIINGRDSGVLEVYRDESGFLISLESFVDIAGVELNHANGEVEIITPIGTVIIHPKYVLELDAQYFIRDEGIEEQLAARVEFKLDEFALVISLPWYPGVDFNARDDEPLQEADIKPPNWNVASLRTELRTLYSDNETTVLNITDIEGRVGGGAWRLRLQRQADENLILSDYSWQKVVDKRVYSIGHQRLALHPVLPGFQITGFNAISSNRDLDQHRSGRLSDINLRQSKPVRDVIGDGPPGGIAQLRIDDVVVALRSIGLDGRYEFRDIVIPAGQLSRIEVWEFDRFQPNTPVDRQVFTQSTSQYLLRNGELAHTAGVGVEGNPLDDNSNPNDSNAAYYQWRYGISDSVTVEAVVQHTRDETFAMAGTVIRLSENWVAATSVAANQQSDAIHAELDGRGESWRFRAFGQEFGDSYLSPGSSSTQNIYAEYSKRVSEKLQLGVVGRQRQFDASNVEFLKPTLEWWASRYLNFRFRPNADGDIRYDTNWQPNYQNRLRLSYENGRRSLDYDYRFNRHYQAIISARQGGLLADQYDLSLQWYGLGRSNANWQVGVSFSEGNTGFFAAARRIVLPGLYAQLEIRDNQFNYNGFESSVDDTLVSLSLTGDFTLGSGRLRPANASSIDAIRGGISGGIRIRGSDMQGVSLEGVALQVDGRPGTRTTSGGSFFIGGLRPGIYNIRLDLQGLPIELTPEIDSIRVEVAASAVTQADFWVVALYGVAGRIVDPSGRSMANQIIELYQGNKRMGSSQSDEFGLYRIDNLPNGRYLLRAGKQGQATAERFIHVQSDFLFGQDLVIGSLDE